MKIRTIIGAALFSVALFISASAGAMTIERIGPVMAHPWGMDFLDHDTVLVTLRGGGLQRIDLADGSATTISGLPQVFDHRQGGMLDVMVDGRHLYLCYAAA